MTTREFFQALEETHFPTFQALQETVLREFNRNLEQFPRHYDYLQLIDWARSKGWIVPADGRGFRIRVADQPVVNANGASRSTLSEELRALEAALA